jgi:DNA polymerase
MATETRRAAHPPQFQSWPKIWRGFLPDRAWVMLSRKAPTPQATGIGDPQAQLVFVSAGPDSQEGDALLTKMIEAMGFKREQVYLCNAESLDATHPKIIVALGELVTRTLLATQASLSELRGKFYPHGEARVMPTFHPSDLLLNPGSKRETWQDLQQVARELGMVIPSHPKKA